MVQQGDERDKLPSLDEWGKEFGKQLEDLSQVNAEALVEVAEEVGKYLTKGKYSKGKDKPPGHMNLKVNQIRRFLDAVRRIEAELKGQEFEKVKDSIVLLRPKLAYAAGREEQVKPLMNVLDLAIKSGAQSESKFKKLLRLIESIIAYHNYYGGKNQ